MSDNPKRKGKVGYGHPPKEHQFKPGQSGNKSGRRKGARDLKTDLAEELEEKVTVTENGKRVQLPKSRLMIKGQVNKAVKGDTRAAEHVYRLHQQLIGTPLEDRKAMPTAAADAQLIADYYKKYGGDLSEARNEGAPTNNVAGSPDKSDRERDDDR